MRTSGLLKDFGTKLGARITAGLDRVAGDPDSAAAPITNETDHAVTMSEIDADSAGFTPELR